MGSASTSVFRCLPIRPPRGLRGTGWVKRPENLSPAGYPKKMVKRSSLNRKEMIKEEKLEHQKKLKTWQAKIWVYAMGFSHLEFSKLIIVKITQGILNIEEILKTEKAI